jgi:hypothetical protein
MSRNSKKNSDSILDRANHTGKKVASWITILSTIIGAIIAVVSTIFFAGYYYKFAEQEVVKYKDRIETLENKVRAVSAQHDTLLRGVDRQFDRLSSESKIVSRHVVMPDLIPRMSGEAETRCENGQYIVGLRAQGIGIAGVGAVGQIIFVCSAFPRLKISN